MKKLIIITELILVICLLASVSCSKVRTESDTASVPMEAPPPMIDVGEKVSYSTEGTGILLSSAEERMIVRTGEMSLVVENVVTSVNEINQLAVTLGGYVVSSRISGEEQEMRGSISIRVPDEKFEEAMTELRNLSIRVDSESTNSRDVTEEYVDLEARLKNAEATEGQYLSLLDEAKDVDDILRIYDSLSRVRREIEQIKGQMQYLERTSSMSLLTVRLEPAVTAKPLVPVGWSLLEVFKSVIRGIITFGQWLITAVIVLLILLPIWGTVLGIILWRRHHRRNSE